MNCCQCQGIEELFNQKYVRKELSQYRARGADETTSMLTDAIRKEGVQGLTLLDIGGGLGAVQHALIEAGVQQVVSVEASAAYIQAAEEEIRRRGQAGRVSIQHGDFVKLAEEIAPADIVTLDRVICCYPEMEKLVSRSASRARKLYGLVYPRDTWWIKIGLALENVYFRLRGSCYRAYVHPTKAVDALLNSHGLERRSHKQTLIWQVVVYVRSSSRSLSA